MYYYNLVYVYYNSLWVFQEFSINMVGLKFSKIKGWPLTYDVEKEFLRKKTCTS